MTMTLAPGRPGACGGERGIGSALAVARVASGRRAGRRETSVKSRSSGSAAGAVAAAMLVGAVAIMSESHLRHDMRQHAVVREVLSCQIGGRAAVAGVVTGHRLDRGDRVVHRLEGEESLARR